jgi:hypothetical protein
VRPGDSVSWPQPHRPRAIGAGSTRSRRYRHRPLGSPCALPRARTTPVVSSSRSCCSAPRSPFALIAGFGARRRPPARVPRPARLDRPAARLRRARICAVGHLPALRLDHALVLRPARDRLPADLHVLPRPAHDLAGVHGLRRRPQRPAQRAHDHADRRGRRRSRHGRDPANLNCASCATAASTSAPRCTASSCCRRPRRLRRRRADADRPLPPGARRARSRCSCPTSASTSRPGSRTSTASRSASSARRRSRPTSSASASRWPTRSTRTIVAHDGAVLTLDAPLPAGFEATAIARYNDYGFIG